MEGFHETATSEAIGLLLIRLTLRCHRIENDLAHATNLSVHELQCLLQLYLEKPCCVRRLTEILGIGGTSTSKLLRSLDRKGYLTRNLDPDDRRKETVTLTVSGLQTVNKGLMLAEAISQRHLQHIPREQVEWLFQILELTLCGPSIESIQALSSEPLNQ